MSRDGKAEDIKPEPTYSWRVEEEFIGAIRGQEQIEKTSFVDGVRHAQLAVPLHAAMVALLGSLTTSEAVGADAGALHGDDGSHHAEPAEPADGVTASASPLTLPAASMTCYSDEQLWLARTGSSCRTDYPTLPIARQALAQGWWL